MIVKNNQINNQITRPVVKVWRRTETGEAPRWQGATTTENTGSYREYLREEQRRQPEAPPGSYATNHCYRTLA